MRPLGLESTSTCYATSILWICCLTILLRQSVASLGSHRATFFRRGGADGFEIVKETVLHDNWRRLIVRRVRFPSLLEVDFEIVAQKGTDKAVLVFVWDSTNKTATLVMEYMPSTHGMMLGLAAGMVEDDKHGSTDASLTAAQHEVEEECRMRGGRWYRLTDDVVMDKYSTTTVRAFLVVDAEVIAVENDSMPRDETEEGMQAVHGVTVDELLGFISSGRMTIVGGWASLLALGKLRELGEVN